MSTIKPESASHWYDQDGNPCHEVPRSDGEGMRKTTLADARKLGLLPSVTNVMSILRKPYIDAWRADKYVEATLDKVFLAGWAAVDRADIKTAALALAEERMSEAPDLGTAYHATLEEVVLMSDFEGTTVLDRPGVDFVTIAAFVDWYERHCAAAGRPEMTFASNHGYGGTVDWYGLFKADSEEYARFAVADWKTQSTTPGKPVRFWPEWPVQLAAYAYGIHRPDSSIISVVISTTEQGRIEWREWEKSTEFYFDEFVKIFDVWRGFLGKNYDPRGDW